MAWLLFLFRYVRKHCFLYQKDLRQTEKSQVEELKGMQFVLTNVCAWGRVLYDSPWGIRVTIKTHRSWKWLHNPLKNKNCWKCSKIKSLLHVWMIAFSSVGSEAECLNAYKFTLLNVTPNHQLTCFSEGGLGGAFKGDQHHI